MVFAVQSAPRFSWFIDLSGNLRDQAEIFASHDLAEKVLNLNTQPIPKLVVLQEDPQGQSIVQKKVTAENFDDLKVLLPRALANGLVHTTLRLQLPGANPKNAHINVRDASITDINN